MIFKKVIRLLLTVAVTVIAALLVFILFSIAPVDRTPVQQKDFYPVMMGDLERIAELEIPAPARRFSVGFATVNLTPPFPTATAGYGNRRGRAFTGVRDSLYVRAMVIDNGAQKVAIVSADLLIIPPMVTEQLGDRLESIGFNLSNTYLGATHTHNGIGNWGKGATRFVYGKYRQRVVSFIVDRILLSVRQASENMKPSTLRTGAIPVPKAVRNRVIQGGPEDPLLRVMEVRRDDSTRLVLLSFTAHATCLSSKDLDLSRDYPGALVDTLEGRGYDFAMFLAGAMASHGTDAPRAGAACAGWMAGEISNQFFSNRDKLRQMNDSSLVMVRVPLLLSDPQVRISGNWKVRSWLFRAALGEYPAYLTGLRVGDAIFLGSPGDFSGVFNPSLDSLGSRYGYMPVPTGFNGGYIGYLTPRDLYDHDHFETRFMNWYAPGTGEYVTAALAKILEGLAGPDS